ncbi:MAG: deoxyribodipyrimidine photo-lyase [Nitrospiraceae bacterium]|jgi:deoxyribodipyrimidine photo-lyase|nr:deoxyribodipyrimidine photo-lyase [Nitrospiraceae bacterium]
MSHSEPRYHRALVWFRRDLRIADNPALTRALRESAEILPLFIFDTNILSALPHRDPRVRFLADAVGGLAASLKNAGAQLLILEGDPVEILPGLLRKHRIEALYHARAYSAYGTQRDDAVARICSEQGVDVHSMDDSLLVPPAAMGPRKVFTPFFRAWQQIDKTAPAPAPTRIPGMPVTAKPGAHLIDRHAQRTGLPWQADGWKQLLRTFDPCRYAETRNQPGIAGTSRMSPYLRFGLLSIRQLYRHVISTESPSCHAGTFISELAWRDFWYHIMHHFPETRTFEFQAKRRGLAWRYDAARFAAWQEGKTGYPIVDAGMRQLRQEGWMHGRVRMIVASFLTKDLLMDWRMGERHFADLLLDYDESVNIGNWQWSASVGADPKPLRIFSPILQSQRFDPECTYIKRHVPELRNESPARIHDPLKYRLAYCEPIVDHREMQRRARLMYLNAAGH